MASLALLSISASAPALIQFGRAQALHTAHGTTPVRPFPRFEAARMFLPESPVRSQTNTKVDLRASLAEQLLATSGESISMLAGEHTRLHVRRVTSTCWCERGQVVPCLSLTHIQVNPNHRRQGHARETLRALHKVACDYRRVLIVDNVVSDHMHVLIGELGGKALPGSHVGRKGCNYWIPASSPDASFHEFAL